MKNEGLRALLDELAAIRSKLLGIDALPEAAGLLDEAAAACAETADRLRDVRYRAAPVPPKIASCPLAAIVDTACSNSSELLQSCGARISLTLAPDIHVLADRHQIQRVLRTLIAEAAHNSAKLLTLTANPAGLGFVKIGVLGAAGAKAGLLDAPGHHPEAGLALSVCRAIVEAHGGQIWIEDEHGSEGRFSFLLQIAEPA